MSWMVAMAAPPPAPAPPTAPRRDHRQVWHGQSYSDPYFWLREKDSKAVLDYLAAENAYTTATTQDQEGLRESLYKEMLGRIKQTDLSVPVRNRGYFYYTRMEEGRQYPLWCRKKGSLEAAEEVYLDINALAQGLPFLGVGASAISEDSGLLAYCTDATGYRQYLLHVKDLKTGKSLPDTAERVDEVEWANDHRTLFFVTEDKTTKRQNQLWRMRLGEKPELIFEEKDELYDVGLQKTRDQKYLLLDIRSTDTWETRLLSADDPKGTFRVVLPRQKGHKYEVDHREGLLYLRTNRGAKNFKIVTAPLADPSPRNWKEFVSPRPDVLVESLNLFRTFAVVNEKTLALDRFRVFDFAKGIWHEVGFPDAVYTARLSSTPEFDTPAFRFTYQSMVTPPAVFDYEPATQERKLLKQEEVLGGFDPRNYRTERLWATARDGVKVPISILYRKDFKRDGQAPLFLYGYGSYGFGMSAGFNPSRLSLVDRGIPFAIAHIRGGDELGEGWHEDGMLMKKKNTFFDFIDCAEFLIKEKWVARDGVLAEGGSAGGLLIGAVVNERPDLFRAVHAAVPFVDVMNTEMDASLPGTVREWLEWGDPNEKPAFDYMMSYSPYDNLKKGAYPAMLVTTSYNDSQVMYWEPAKYVAKLRTLKTDSTPLLLKCRMDPGGHGGASGRYDVLRDRAFEYAWFLNQLGMRQ
jgi:oligopeptidase B